MAYRTASDGTSVPSRGDEPDGRSPWMLVGRIAVPLAVVGVLLLVKPEIVRGTFSSGESMLRVGAVVVAWIVFSWLTRRVIPNPLVRAAVVAVPAAALLWFTVAPYFQEETVDEPLPAAVAATEAPAAPAGDDTVGAAQAPAPEASAAPSGPVKVSTGQLRGLDGHRGAGEAALYRQPDGSVLVRLEDFEVSNTPGPVLYLVPGAGQESPGDGVKLGSLRGSQGSQNFTLPPGMDVGPESTVLIWCEPFAVAIAGASQQAV